MKVKVILMNTWCILVIEAVTVSKTKRQTHRHTHILLNLVYVNLFKVLEALKAEERKSNTIYDTSALLNHTFKRLRHYLHTLALAAAINCGIKTGRLRFPDCTGAAYYLYKRLRLISLRFLFTVYSTFPK